MQCRTVSKIKKKLDHHLRETIADISLYKTVFLSACKCNILLSFLSFPDIILAIKHFPIVA